MNLHEYLLFEFVSKKYCGTVEIKFEAGLPVLIRKTQTLKREREDSRQIQ